MCVTSMIYDYGQRNPPWQQITPWPGIYPGSPLPDQQAREAMQKFLDLIQNAKEYDRAAKQPDCEDPKKAEFMQQILDRLDAIEKRLGK